MMSEVASADAVAAAIAAHGFAVWRGMCNQLLCQFMQAFAIDRKVEARFNGALTLAETHPDLQDLACRGSRAHEVFSAVLGRYALVQTKWECILIYAHDSLRGTTWHQEAETIPANTLICWVNLTAGCGVTSPTLGLVARAFDAPHPILLEDDDDQAAQKDAYIREMGLPTLAPSFAIGDAVFFNRHTVHRTVPVGDKARVAFKLTGISI